MRPQQPTVALAISGGNALGAYAAGAYHALHGRGSLDQFERGDATETAHGFTL